MPNIATEAQSIQSRESSARQTGGGGQRGWDFIDKIYCISLDHRLDRQRQAAEQFARVGLDDRVEFRIGIKHPTNAERGNFIAQMECLRAGMNAGANTICIFEDDIVFDRFSMQKLDRAVEFMRSNRDWKILFLGCFVKTARPTRFPSVIRIRFRSLTHAYIINREFAGKLLEMSWPGRCLDDLICSMNDPDMYAVHPMIAFQSNSPTDNDRQLYLDKLRRALGGLRPLQKLNEFAAVNRFRLVLLHVVAALGLIAWFIARRHGDG